MEQRKSDTLELVVLAGQIGSGKSTVAEYLADNFGCQLIRVRELLAELIGGAEIGRSELQLRGHQLDRQSRGRWLLESISARTDCGGRWVLDAGRTRLQVEPILKSLPSTLVYLDASLTTRRIRYSRGQGNDPVKRLTSFDEAMDHPTETEACTLKAMAMLVIETDGLDAPVVADTVAQAMKWT